MDHSMNKFLMGIMCVFLSGAASAALPFADLYQTIDDKTGNPKSIVQLYEYQDGDDMKLAGRIVALYGADGQVTDTPRNAVRVAENVPGAPKYVGLDIIWDMEWDRDENRYEDGKIMDPQSGKVYSSLLWQDVPGHLNVRGKIGPFGRTQHWVEITDPASYKQDSKNWTPIIRK